MYLLLRKSKGRRSDLRAPPAVPVGCSSRVPCAELPTPVDRLCILLTSHRCPVAVGAASARMRVLSTAWSTGQTTPYRASIYRGRYLLRPKRILFSFRGWRVGADERRTCARARARREDRSPSASFAAGGGGWCGCEYHGEQYGNMFESAVHLVFPSLFSRSKQFSHATPKWMPPRTNALRDRAPRQVFARRALPSDGTAASGGEHAKQQVRLR